MKAFGPKPVPVVSIDHIHMVRVSVREHAAILREKLLRLRTATFRALCADCRSTLEVVARFLALLELYREGLVAFDQMTALGELTVRWIGDDAAGLELAIDEYGDEPNPEADTGGADGGGRVTEDDLVDADDRAGSMSGPAGRAQQREPAHGGGVSRR